MAHQQALKVAAVDLASYSLVAGVVVKVDLDASDVSCCPNGFVVRMAEMVVIDHASLDVDLGQELLAASYLNIERIFLILRSHTKNPEKSVSALIITLWWHRIIAETHIRLWRKWSTLHPWWPHAMWWHWHTIRLHHWHSAHLAGWMAHHHHWMSTEKLLLWAW